MKRDCLKMKILWVVARIANKLYGRKLICADVSLENDKWGVPYIKMTTTVSELIHRIGIIQTTDTLVCGIRNILYCFNLKPHKI